LPDVIVLYHQDGRQASDLIVLPSDALDDLEGTDDSEVVLTSLNEGGVQARWLNGGVPRVKEYHEKQPDKQPTPPTLPAKLTPMAAGFLKALEAAGQSTARDHVRYAVNSIQVRGSKGQLVATDGRQLLIQG